MNPTRVIDPLYTKLLAARQSRCFPPQLREVTSQIAERSLALLFPHFSERRDCTEACIEEEVEILEADLTFVATAIDKQFPEAAEFAPRLFSERLPLVHEALLQDAHAIFSGDPAARSVDEIILAYPGFLAIAVYRLAHELYSLRLPLLPRLLTEWSHARTGVDIHPGAKIGRGFFIDHGTGLVIGETAEIGNGVKLYQGVTLGALAVSKALDGAKRHPTIQDNVVIYANATVLGGETVVGHDSVIGGNAWITHSVPPFSTVNRESVIRKRTDKGSEESDYQI